MIRRRLMAQEMRAKLTEAELNAKVEEKENELIAKAGSRSAYRCKGWR